MTSGVDEPGCVFCRAASEPDGEDSLVVFRGETCFVILNLYPYNNGHLMVALGRHVGTLAETNRAERQELMELTRQAEIVITSAYKPHGLNVGVNVGRSAGAGVADHLHMHVVPRWNGDTNFMSVLGSVRVLPEALQQTAERLRPLFRSRAT